MIDYKYVNSMLLPLLWCIKEWIKVHCLIDWNQCIKV